MDKQQLREHIQRLRNSLTDTERTAMNKSILDNLVTIPEVQSAQTILLYISFKNEVALEPLYQWGWEQGKVMAVPATIPAERKLIPIAIDSFNDLTPSSFGVREPRLAEGVPPDAIDVVLLPGVAFDKRGYRLGYGGGYYDRFLPLLPPRAMLIGVAYELQLLKEIPIEAHDIPLDRIVTDKQIWNCRA